MHFLETKINMIVGVFPNADNDDDNDVNDDDNDDNDDDNDEYDGVDVHDDDNGDNDDNDKSNLLIIPASASFPATR